MSLDDVICQIQLLLLFGTEFHDCFRNRMVACFFQCFRQSKSNGKFISVTFVVSIGQNLAMCDLHLAFSQCASLIKHDHIKFGCFLESFSTTLYQYTMLGGKATANKECSRRGKSNAARACDNEDGNGEF